MVPVRIITSQILPSQELFRQYPRLGVLYAELVKAVKLGDLYKFDLLIKHNPARRSVLIKRYLYSSMDHLRLLTSLSVLRQVVKIEGGTNRLEVDKYRRALKVCGYGGNGDEESGSTGTSDDDNNNDNDVDIDEAEYLIATLINHGQVKGYISHERRIAVLSNNSPFPKFSSAK